MTTSECIPDATNVRVVHKGDGEISGTWYFLESWILLICLGGERHNVIMPRYRIPKEQVELCGWFNKTNVILRDSCDWELTKPVLALMKAELVRTMDAKPDVTDG